MPRRKCGNSKTKNLRPTSKHRARAKSKPDALCVPHSPRAVRHNLSHKKTGLGLARMFVQNKVAELVVACGLQRSVAECCSLVNVLRAKGKVAAVFYQQRSSHLSPCPDFIGGPNVSITRWPVATNDACAPNDDDHAKVAVELGA
jgi:hypothetical protein